MSKRTSPPRDEWQERIDAIMAHFDFERVHQYMTAVGWKWVGTKTPIPTIDDLRVQARRVMETCVRMRHTTYGTGGFVVTRNLCSLRLHFEMSAWGEPVEETI